MGLLGKLFGTKHPAPPCAIHEDDRSLVRREDLDWWQGLTLDDCKAFEKQDNTSIVAMLMEFSENEGLDEEAAVRKVRLKLPYYYWTLPQRSEDVFSLSAADAKIPYVIKDRINRALIRGNIKQVDIAKASSFNGLVREMILAGSI